jgi:hypothetical protein
MKRTIICFICILVFASALIGCALLAEVRGVTSQLHKAEIGMTVEEVKAKCGVPHFSYEDGDKTVFHYINLSSEGTVGHGSSRDYLLIFTGGKLAEKREVTDEITRRKKRDSEEIRALCMEAREKRFGAGIKKYCDIQL